MNNARKQEEAGIEELNRVTQEDSKRDREQAKMEYDSLIKNSEFFGEYFYASKWLREVETPYAWIQAKIEGYTNARAILTDKRLLLFGMGFKASSIALKEAFDLDKIEKAWVERVSSQIC